MTDTEHSPKPEQSNDHEPSTHDGMQSMLDVALKCDRCQKAVATKRKETFLFCDACAPKDSESLEPSGMLCITLTKCPKCGSTDVTTRRHESFAFGEVYFDYCNECEHQWNQA